MIFKIFGFIVFNYNLVFCNLEQKNNYFANDNNYFFMMIIYALILVAMFFILKLSGQKKKNLEKIEKLENEKNEITKLKIFSENIISETFDYILKFDNDGEIIKNNNSFNYFIKKMDISNKSSNIFNYFEEDERIKFKIQMKNSKLGKINELITYITVSNKRNIEVRQKILFNQLDNSFYLIGKNNDKEDIEKSIKKEFNEMYKDFANCSDIWFWEVNNDWEFTNLLGHYKEIIGFEYDELINNSFFELLFNDEIEVLTRNAKHKNEIKNLEYWIVTKDKDRKKIRTRAVPILDSTKELKGYRGVNIEIKD